MTTPRIYTKEDMHRAYRTAKRIWEHSLRQSDFDMAIGGSSRPDNLRLFMEILKVDLFGSSLTHALFPKTNKPKICSRDFIPCFPLPQKRIVDRRINMPVGDNMVVSVPWSISKRNGIFLPELQLIQICGAPALVKLKIRGVVDVDICPLVLCFPYFKTDGAYWINKRSGKKEPVREIRFAILYALARELWKEGNREKSGV